LKLSLLNKLALVSFAVTLVAVGTLYMYVAPGLQTRLLDQKLSQLAHAACSGSYYLRYGARRSGTRWSARHSGTRWHKHCGRASTLRAIESLPLATIRSRVDTAADSSGYRVSLLSATRTRGRLKLSLQADSSRPTARQPLSFPVAAAAASVGELRAAIESTKKGIFAEAADPIRTRTGTDVIVFSARTSGLARSVAVVRHEILVAGLIALLVGLVGNYGVARALSQRVKRLERAAERIAAGEFEHPIRVDSTDELGQLAIAFNAMQRQLAQLELARKKFIATASHELRTPIFSLGGFVELLEDEDLDPETRRRFLDQLREQIERLRKLSVDLLDLSKLESGSLELRPEEVDLTELTRSVLGEFEPTVAQHDSQLELQLAPPSITVTCDPVRVAQIMRIMIDNAITHTRPGTTVVVSAGRENGHARVAVRDDGEGIDPLALQRIFEPFYTGENAQGSGLGLAIASELAERMAGRLSVRSAPGATTFTLDMPA